MPKKHRQHWSSATKTETSESVLQNLHQHFMHLLRYKTEAQMKESWEHTLFVDPIPQGRPRFTKNGKPYDPKRQEKDAVRLLLKAARAHTFFKKGTPLSVQLIFGMRIPKSWNQAKQKKAKDGKIRHVSTPDVDNLVKFILDCCNGIIWDDDSHVWSLDAKKIYSESPHIYIRVKSA